MGECNKDRATLRLYEVPSKCGTVLEDYFESLCYITNCFAALILETHRVPQQYFSYLSGT